MSTRREFLKAGGLAISAFGFTGGFIKSLFSGQTGPARSDLENMVAGVEPVTAEDYTARLQKASRLMTEHGLSGLFLEGGANLIYFTGVGWSLSERTFGAVLNPKKLPIWVCPAFELERAMELIPEGHQVRTWEEHESPYKLMAGILGDLGASGGRLGLGPRTRAFILYGIESEAPGLEIVDGAVVTEGCRGIKAPKEIAYMDLANKITKLAYREGFKNLRGGMSQRDLAGAVSQAHQQMGVSGGGWPQFGPNTAFPHGSRTPRDLREGEVVMIDGGCAVEGFRADVTRTIVFGKPIDKQRRVWDVVRRAQRAAFETVRPGVACEDVDRAARRVIEEAGFGPGYKYFAHRVGHGIGMEGHEYPYLVKGNTLPLRPGMTFSDEPGIYIYGEFGVRIEDCFVVTEEGGRILGGLESESIEMPFS